MKFLPLCATSPAGAAGSLADDDLEPAWRYAVARIGSALEVSADAEHALRGLEAYDKARLRGEMDVVAARGRLKRTEDVLKRLPGPFVRDRLTDTILWRHICWEWLVGYAEWARMTAQARGIEFPSVPLLHNDYGGPGVWSRNECFEASAGPDSWPGCSNYDVGPVFLATLPPEFASVAGGWTTLAVTAHRARYWHYLQRLPEGPAWDRSLQRRGYTGPEPSPKWYRSWAPLTDQLLDRKPGGRFLRELLPLLYDGGP